MNITVYLGAKEGNDPALKRAVQELGQWIGQSGNALVYGGSKTGLMGEIAKSVLDAGGTVTGVETTLFMQDDLQYDGLTELIVTETITERKTEMIRRGDAFIAFPGGIIWRRNGYAGGDHRSHVQGIAQAAGCSLRFVQPEWLL